MGNHRSKSTRRDKVDVHQGAVLDGDAVLLKKLLEHGKYDVNTPYKHGTTLLHLAAEQGNAKCLQVLLDAGAKRDQVDAVGFTPIYLASTNGHIDCVRLLVQSRANLDLQDTWGWTALHKAIINHRYTTAELLIDAGCNVNIPDEHKRAPLHVAASYGNVDLVEKLLESGANINWQDRKGRTPLYLTVVGNQKHIINLLVRHGCDINLPNVNQVTPLAFAAQKGYVSCVQVLLNLGASTDGSRKDNPPVMAAMMHSANRDGAAKADHINIVKMLLRANGDQPHEGLFFYIYRALQQAQQTNSDNTDMIEVLNLLFLAGFQEVQHPCINGTRPLGEIESLIDDLVTENKRKPLSLFGMSVRQIRKQLHLNCGNVTYGVRQLGLPTLLSDSLLLKL